MEKLSSMKPVPDAKKVAALEHKLPPLHSLVKEESLPLLLNQACLILLA